MKYVSNGNIKMQMEQNSCVGVSKSKFLLKNKVHMSQRLIETLTQISIIFIVFFYILWTLVTFLWESPTSRYQKGSSDH